MFKQQNTCLLVYWHTSILVYCNTEQPTCYTCQRMCRLKTSIIGNLHTLAYLHICMPAYFDTNIVANMHTLACQRICSRILETFLLAYLQAGILAFLHNSIQYVNTGTQTYKRTIKIYTTILAYLSILANMHTLAYYCLCSQILENILTCIL